MDGVFREALRVVGRRECHVLEDLSDAVTPLWLQWPHGWGAFNLTLTAEPDRAAQTVLVQLCPVSGRLMGIEVRPFFDDEVSLLLPESAVMPGEDAEVVGCRQAVLDIEPFVLDAMAEDHGLREAGFEVHCPDLALGMTGEATWVVLRDVPAAKRFVIGDVEVGVSAEFELTYVGRRRESLVRGVDPQDAPYLVTEHELVACTPETCSVNADEEVYGCWPPGDELPEPDFTWRQ